VAPTLATAERVCPADAGRDRRDRDSLETSIISHGEGGGVHDGRRGLAVIRPEHPRRVERALKATLDDLGRNIAPAFRSMPKRSMLEPSQSGHETRPEPAPPCSTVSGSAASASANSRAGSILVALCIASSGFTWHCERGIVFKWTRKTPVASAASAGPRR
jgi:hypothetical protein